MDCLVTGPGVASRADQHPARNRNGETVKHTKKCVKQHARYAEERAEWQRQHPGFCEACDGWGYLSSPGCSVPYGATYVALPDEVHPCASCFEQGKCPHCGAQLENFDSDLAGEHGPECCCWALPVNHED